MRLHPSAQSHAASFFDESLSSEFMQPKEIAFSIQHHALCLNVATEAELPEALRALGLAAPRLVLVLVGGASGLQKEHAGAIDRAISAIVQLAEATGIVIIDGGTQSGVMAWIGQARAQHRGHFPLVGVAVERLVTSPGGPQENERVQLEPNHTHFILLPGERWGDESSWIAKIATLLAGELPSATLLINGGEISRRDVAHSLEAGRPVVILKGTGRLADELANKPLDPLMTVISSGDLSVIAEHLRALLTKR
jgi:hypothetical protein